MIQSRIRRLVNKTQFAPHQYAVGLETFPRLNLDHISRDLRLVELGAERGDAEEPAKDDEGLDQVEERIVAYVCNKQTEAQAAFEEQRRTYGQRLAKLGFHTVLAEIEDAAKAAAAEIDVQVQKARGLESELRRQISAAEAEWAAFRTAHLLTRPARYPTGLGDWVLRWGLLAVVVLLETLMNGYFFAKGNDLGLLGGWFEAGIIALVNVALGLGAGHFAARWAVDRRPPLKRLGVSLIFVWFSVAAIFNLGVGHYRAALEQLAENPEVIALSDLLAHPFGLTSLHSWMLLFIGIFFSTAALLDGLSMDDVYPGYGAVDRQREGRRQAYIDEGAALLDEVGAVYEAGVEGLAAKAGQIGKRRDESETIRAGLSALKAGYLAHLQYLEDSANGLMEIYRDANRKARPPKTAPASFRKRWKAQFPPVEPDDAPHYSQAELAALIKKGAQLQRLGDRRLERARNSAPDVFPPLGGGAG